MNKHITHDEGLDAVDNDHQPKPFKLNAKGVCENCKGNYFYDIGVEECPYCVAGYKVRKD